MALVRGTNAGFLTTAPTVDPNGSDVDTVDNNSYVFLDTSPSNVNKITEVGWWCGTATEAANFEMALYAANGTGGVAGTRLFVANTNAKGTTSGWKKVTVDWDISPSTNYWIGFQLDNTSSSTITDIEVGTGIGSYDIRTAQTTLNNPYGGGTIQGTNVILPFYAVVANINTNTSNFFQFF